MQKIARVKITLTDVRPTVMRQIEVPLDITLFDLHLVIQAAMPWDNDHMFEFSTSRHNRWGLSEMFGEFDDGPNDASNVTLNEALNSSPPAVPAEVRALLLAFHGPAVKQAAPKRPAGAATARKRAKTMSYLYDFGDSWRHTLNIEKIEEAEPGLSYPRLLAATGRCPPEDCGGPWGYADIQEALADPKRRRRLEDPRLLGFDPDTVDMDKLVRNVAAGSQVLTPRSETSAPVTEVAQPKRGGRKRKTA